MSSRSAACETGSSGKHPTRCAGAHSRQWLHGVHRATLRRAPRGTALASPGARTSRRPAGVYRLPPLRTRPETLTPRGTGRSSSLKRRSTAATRPACVSTTSSPAASTRCSYGGQIISFGRKRCSMSERKARRTRPISPPASRRLCARKLRTASSRSNGYRPTPHRRLRIE